MNQIPISMVALATAIRDEAELDAQHLYGKQVIFSLPSSGDIVTLWPAPSKASRPLSLCWAHSTPDGKTIEGGYLEWGSDPKPFINWAISRAYSINQITPQYAPVVDALRGRGLNTSIAPADGGGFFIRIDLPDSTYLQVGGEENLPSRADQVKQWHAQHQSVNDNIAVVYHGASVDEMINVVDRYIRGTLIRYGGRHPLGAPAPGDRPDGPDKLYGLISDLSAIRRLSRTAPGGALITIADADGSNGATIEVPAEAVTRISRLLAVELKVIDAYGG
ncbi:hypothetical protein ACI2L4_09980 [Streptomyces sparsogenes]|uniref:hypothetical protein n=1 Tax=Streptomyces sparsogenes TaxID=67365 RepID=UPI0038507217